MKKLVGFITIVTVLVIQYLFSGINTKVSGKYFNISHLKSKDRKPHVILVAYMRSGSSFVGNILQYNPDVFYVFEPLYTLEQYYISNINKPITFFHKPPFFMGDVDYEELKNEYVSNVLSCDFKNLDIDTLTHIHWIRGKMEPYYQCLIGNWEFKSTNKTAKMSTLDLKSISRSNILRCLHFLYNECDKRNVSLTKLIRYKLTGADVLLGKYPNYKIIHLVRDPRAILYSRHRIGFKKFQVTVQNQSKELCESMYDDVIMYEYLRHEYKNRIKLVRYEDLVDNPSKEFETLYQFMNVSFGGEQRDYIKNLTDHNGRPCAYCVSNKKAAETAHAWRYTIDWDFMKVIESNCKDVFDYLGYRSIENKTRLLDRAFNVYDSKQSTHILSEMFTIY